MQNPGPYQPLNPGHFLHKGRKPVYARTQRIGPIWYLLQTNRSLEPTWSAQKGVLECVDLVKRVETDSVKLSRDREFSLFKKELFEGRINRWRPKGKSRGIGSV